MLNTRPLDGVGIPVFWFSKNTTNWNWKEDPIFSRCQLVFLLKELPSRFFFPFYFFVYFWSKVWSILVKMCTLCSLPELFRTKLNSAPHFGYSCKYFPPVYYIYIYSSIYNKTITYINYHIEMFRPPASAVQHTTLCLPTLSLEILKYVWMSTDPSLVLCSISSSPLIHHHYGVIIPTTVHTHTLQ